MKTLNPSQNNAARAALKSALQQVKTINKSIVIR